MIVYILHDDKYYTFRLPKVVDGSFVLYDYDKNNFKRNLVNIVGSNSKWIMKSNENNKLFNNGKFIESVELKEYLFYTLITKYNETIFLYVSPGNDTSFVAKRVSSDDVSIIFGKDASSDIIVSSPNILPKQLELKRVNYNWQIKSYNNSSLLFVNGRRTTNKLLKNFDFVFINGYKIIICNDILFINNPYSTVSFNSQKLTDVHAQYAVANVSSSVASFGDFYESSDYFSKSPVFRKRVKTLFVTITSPEEKAKKNDGSFMMSIFPSALMSLTTVLSGYYSIKNYHAGKADKESLITTLVMCLVMVFVSIAWPFIEKFAETIKYIINNKNRKIKYTKYLKGKRKLLESTRSEQKMTLQFNNLSIKECQDTILKRTSNMFSVSIEQPNFLDVKLGVGRVKMDCEFDYTKPDFIKSKDNLLDDIDKLIDDYKYIDDAPYSFSLTNNVAFIYGQKNYEDYLASIIIQIITFHDYHNLKLVLFTNKNSFLSSIRNLNHVWGQDRTMRFYATNISEAETLSSYLMRIFNSRGSTSSSDIENTKTPHYLIICDDIDRYRNLSIIDKVLHQKDDSLGFSFVTFAEKITDVPDCCSYFVDFQSDKSTLFQSEMDESNIMSFIPEVIDSSIDVNKCISTVANIPIKINSDMNSLLPEKLGFLEMNNVGTVEQLNSLNRWKESQIINTLEAPIGVDSNGNILLLDLHEKKHGPHGLIAGMTGSGKSEFIITYILSLAVNYSPDEVQFVLIDYKGGGLAGAFENRKTGLKLPHLVGTITNLDKSSMNRTLVSIKSELQRRQRVFNESKELLNSGTIDIYKYQKLVRDGSLKEPMSHLFIICDEFAELKAQQPEFMDELVSAARIGRSLGIHLILATQKPAGVVDDQIWSNSKFKVCCKVQTADDSNEMIRRSDAAYIKESGRFYLQVGYDEIFIKGQSAYTGTQYVPSDNVISNDNAKDDIEFIDDLGNVIASVKNNVKVESDKADYGDELSNVLQYLIKCAREGGYKNNQLWLDNVPDKIYLYDLYKKYPIVPKKFIINPLVGEYDDPANQKQGPVFLNITEKGNLWISGVYGSGKTTLMGAMIYSSIVNYSTEELNIFIIDLLAETLKMFASAPQIGDFVSSSEPTKLKKLFNYLNQEVNKRRKYYSDKGTTFLSEAMSGKCNYPNILVYLNGFDVFQEQYDDLFNDIFMPLVRDCNRFGVYFIISSTGSINVMVENSFPQKVALRYLDTSEYNMLFSNSKGIVPKVVPGRGLVELDNVYEYQGALIFDEVNFDYNLNYVLNQLNKLLTKAASIPIMPRVVTYENVKDDIFELDNVPIGIDNLSNCVSSYDFTRLITPIVYSNNNIIASFTRALIRVFNDVKNIKVIVLDNVGVDCNIENIKIFNSNFKKVTEALYKNIVEKKDSNLDSEKIIFIVSGYVNINNHLKKLRQEDDQVKTIDDLILTSLSSDKFKFILEIDKSLGSIDDKEWSDYLDSGYGIVIGTEKDDQTLINMDDNYDDVKVTKDMAIVVNDYKCKYVKVIRDRSL